MASLPSTDTGRAVPNPATDLIFVRLQDLPTEDEEKRLHFVLTDACGRTLRECALSELDTTIDLKGLPAGVYFWQISAANFFRAKHQQGGFRAGRLIKMP